MKRKILKASKRSKKQGEVTRLLDLEVDEVSLVDKPAIGEEIYVSKSVTKEGGTSMAKKKKVKKGEEEVKPKAGAQAEGEEVEETDETEGEEGEAAEDSSADDSSDAEGSEEGDEEGEDEGEEGAASEEVKALKAQVATLAKGQKTLTKSLDEVTQMLAQSMDFHDQAAQALNQVVTLTMGALDMLVNMSESDVADDDAAEETDDAAVEASESSEAVAEAAKAIRLEIKKFHIDVEKAGAKISSSRLTILQEIATKLTALIESVVANNKDAKKGGKKATAKKSVEAESLRTEISELKKSLETATTSNADLKKSVDEMQTRLNDIESQAGGSTGIEDEDDDESDDSSETDAKNKSVFSGLIPVDQIKADVRKRAELAKRK